MGILRDKLVSVISAHLDKLARLLLLELKEKGYFYTSFWLPPAHGKHFP
jgi:hypothetical protein